MNFISLLLQAPTPPAAGGGAMSSMLMIGLVFVLAYFVMIRPQQKRAKEENSFRETLKKGKKVVTIGGIYGTIMDLTDTTVDLLIASKVIITVRRDAISMESSKVLDSKDETIVKEDKKDEQTNS